MRKLLAIITTIALPASACTVHQSTAPSESGPAETSLSLRLFANPDRIPQDGLHPSSLSITAFDAGGHAIAAQVHLSVAPTGFGTLTTDINGNVVTTTDVNKPVVVSYLPPAATTGSNTNVTISASMVGPNSVTTTTQQVSLITQPANGIVSAAPVAIVALNPNTASYATNQAITFDGSASCGSGLVAGVCPSTNAIVAYLWTFGDNTSSSSATAVHAYSAAGAYPVTLTVTNDKNAMASTTQAVVVAVVAAPTASFTFSPTPIVKNVTTVNFNAAASTAATGHILVKYDWNFGDGTSATGMTPQHIFTTTVAGTYTVTLTVTDDVGQTKVTTATVTVT
jgi:chitodextrinase